MRTNTQERGSISVIISLIVLTVGAALIYQIPNMQKGLNTLHRQQKASTTSMEHLDLITEKIKQKYYLAATDPSCSSKELTRQKISGAFFCLPKSGQTCIVLNEFNSQSSVCAITSPPSLKWTFHTYSPRNSPKNISNRKANRAHTSNRITIPDKSSKIWKNCDSPTSICLRVAVCGVDVSPCRESKVVAERIIMLKKF